MPEAVETTSFVSAPISTPPSPKKSFPFIWIALIITAITLASAGTYYVIRSRTPTSTSSGTITDLPTNPFANTPNPFKKAPANPFGEESAPQNPFTPASANQPYQNPFENLP